MGRGCSLLLLLLLLPPGPRAAVSLLRYRYDCGDHGMQLLAHPPPGRTVRFKVLGEKLPPQVSFWGDMCQNL